jgi:hypothetical protein
MRDLLPQHIDVTWGVLIAAPIFLVLFSITIIYVYSRRRKNTYKKIENLPFNFE